MRLLDYGTKLWKQSVTGRFRPRSGPLSNWASFAGRGLAVALSLFVTTALAQTVTFRADNWYPFNGDPTDTKPGYGVEILRAVFEKGAGKMDYAVIPWKRAVDQAEKGLINGVIGVTKTDTPGFVFPEEPIGIYEPMCFVKKGSTWKYTGLDSLKGKRLGIISGYTYGEVLDGFLKQHQGDPQVIDEATGDKATEQSLRKLQAGRLDIYVEAPLVFWANVAKLGLSKDDFIAAGVAGTAEPMFISFSPKKEDSQALASKLTAGIRELRSSGELAKILAKYDAQDWGK